MYPGLGCAPGSGPRVPVCGGRIGGGVWLIRMEIVFSQVGTRASCGSCSEFSRRSVLRRALGSQIARARFGWGLQGMFRLLLPLKERLVSTCHAFPRNAPYPLTHTKGTRRTWLWAKSPVEHMGESRATVGGGRGDSGKFLEKRAWDSGSAGQGRGGERKGSSGRWTSGVGGGTKISGERRLRGGRCHGSHRAERLEMARG